MVKYNYHFVHYKAKFNNYQQGNNKKIQKKLQLYYKKFSENKKKKKKKKKKKRTCSNYRNKNMTDALLKLNYLINPIKELQNDF